MIFPLILLIVFFGFWKSCQAVDVQLNLNYPSIPGVGTLGGSLPTIINYIYRFSLGICGIAALISILIGAIQYVTSAGNSSQIEDAKDRITQALLGVLLLLAAVLILQIINPDLVNLTLPG